MLQPIYQLPHRSPAFRRQSNLRSLNLFEFRTVNILIRVNIGIVVWLVQMHHGFSSAFCTSAVYI